MTYRDQPVGVHRLDLIVRGCIVVELKAVKALEPHPPGTINGLPEGEPAFASVYLMNFGGATFQGRALKRIVM